MQPVASKREQFDSLTTSGAAGTGVTTTLLASSGAGFRFRIFGCSLSPQYNNTGDIQARLQGASSASAIWAGNTSNGIRDVQGFFGDVGITLPEAADVNLFHRASVASQNFWFIFHYIEEVAV